MFILCSQNVNLKLIVCWCMFILCSQNVNLLTWSWLYVGVCSPYVHRMLTWGWLYVGVCSSYVHRMLTWGWLYIGVCSSYVHRMLTWVLCWVPPVISRCLCRSILPGTHSFRKEPWTTSHRTRLVGHVGCSCLPPVYEVQRRDSRDSDFELNWNDYISEFHFCYQLFYFTKKCKHLFKSFNKFQQISCRASVEMETNIILDMMAQRFARRAEDREVPGSSPARD